MSRASGGADIGAKEETEAQPFPAGRLGGRNTPSRPHSTSSVWSSSYVGGQHAEDDERRERGELLANTKQRRGERGAALHFERSRLC